MVGKITEMTSGLPLASADRFEITRDPTGTPLTRYGDVDGMLTYVESNISGLAATVITSGTFADAQISETSVTQHEAALSITESQISDLQSYLLAVVDDATPQLGGDLDVNGASIVSSSNADIDIKPNGTGNVLLGNYVLDVDQTTSPTEDGYVLTYDDTSGLISLEASSGGGGSPGGSSGQIQYNDSSSFGGSLLWQDTDTIEQYDGTNSQEFNIYQTRTDASNYTRAELTWNQTANVFNIQTVGAGTGSSSRNIKLSSGLRVDIQAGGSANNTWRFDGAAQYFGPLQWDNNIDIGRTGIQWRTAWLGGDLVFGEQSDHQTTPAAGKGTLWVRDDSPNVLVFTDDDGTDNVIAYL